MKVSGWMQRKLVTIQKGDTVERAQTLMVVNNIRHLPVMARNRLVGIISDRDIRGIMIRQRVSGAKRKGQYVFYLPQDVKVEEAMTADPIQVSPGADLEEAARTLYTEKIGCLPVAEKGRLVGIITETDVLWVFTQILGVLESSSRIDVVLGEDPQAIEKATEIIRRNRGDIISIGLSPNSDGSQKVYHFRLRSGETGPITHGLKKAGFKIRNVIH